MKSQQKGLAYAGSREEDREFNQDGEDGEDGAGSEDCEGDEDLGGSKDAEGGDNGEGNNCEGNNGEGDNGEAGNGEGSAGSEDREGVEGKGVKPADDKSMQVGAEASALIDKRIHELGDWRGKTLQRMRELIKQADPEIVEEWKWRGTPVWSHNGGVCTGETYKNAVKLTFFQGASLEDPKGLFNSSLDGKVRRAIDIHENDKIDTAGLKKLVRAAVELNLAGKSKASR